MKSKYPLFDRARLVVESQPALEREVIHALAERLHQQPRAIESLKFGRHQLGKREESSSSRHRKFGTM